MRNIAVVIPAIKKNVAFPDDLVKKLAGVSLIQRTIDTGRQAFSARQVHVVTDSEEIELICQRNAVSCVYDKALRLDSHNLLGSLCTHLGPLLDESPHLLLLSPYAPLLKVDELLRACQDYFEREAELMIPVGPATISVFEGAPRPLSKFMYDGFDQSIICESHAFLIVRTALLRQPGDYPVKPVAYPLAVMPLEIRNYQDWWLCEKLLNRRRIVFRVIGNKAVGMGHIFHSLALAHEITDHEIRFVCDTESRVAASKLAGYDYWLGTYPKEDIQDAILELQPDLVINDMLNTEAGYILQLKQNGVRVVNFEDLGSGAAEADLTINDLYDDPLIPGDNILWGKKWFIIRDEFTDAQPRRFHVNVQRLLIAFGGTDPNDYTREVLQLILEYCAGMGIAIDIITGEGYSHIAELEALIAGTVKPVIRYTHATGVMSHLMEQADIAICSNGRTVYELAHMNVPAIVLSHHERETTHQYACEANGFIPLGLCHDDATKEKLLVALRRLVEVADYRHGLFNAMKTTSFTQNKRRVAGRILALLDGAKQAR